MKMNKYLNRTLSILLISLIIFPNVFAINLNFDIHTPKNLLAFIQPDSIIQNIYDPQLLNRYAFERNNPYTYTDPSGNIICGGLCVGAVTLAATTSPYWMPYVSAYFADQSINDIQTGFEDPSAGNLFWVGMGIWDLSTPGVPEGKIAKKAGKVIGKIKKKRIIIGETTDRIIKKAKEIGAKWYKPKNKVKDIGLDKSIDNNKKWLKNKLNEGYEIIDYGIDPSRPIGKGRGPFYQAEKEVIDEWIKSGKDINYKRLPKK